MNNAVRREVDGEDSFYILISDDEDFDDEVLAVAGSPAPGRQEPAVQCNNAQAHSLPPDPNGNGAPQHRGNASASPPREANPALQADAHMAAFIIEDGDEFDVNDPYLAHIMMEAFNREHNEHAARQIEPADHLLPYQQIEEAPAPMVETRDQCVDQVLAVFTGICQDHVSKLYDTVAQSSDFLIAHILDQIDKGKHYPKAKDTQKSLKRKRVDEDEEAARKYGAANRKIPEGADIRILM
jgi:TRIAD3 protein (E3 ubiquitin-protein ligase RNF216)